MNPEPVIRPTKKQRELLTFIETFIAQHSYSPSYREIMSGLKYNSVATVALHVNSLIKRGHLKKRDRSARSLEVVHAKSPARLSTNQIAPTEEKWLIDKVEYFFRRVEQSTNLDQTQIDQLIVLIGALKVLGLNGAAQSFLPRLQALRNPAAKAGHER
jgi:SOS-response transcriptional repressor LexA